MILSVALPLICGNTVVVRPSEICPHASSLVADALHDVGKLTRTRLVSRLILIPGRATRGRY
jgi:acyl-CoA reductase-like NAD-dependent aldehyde dehydrogenase